MPGRADDHASALSGRPANGLGACQLYWFHACFSHEIVGLKLVNFGSVGLRLALVKAFWVSINFHGGLRARKV
jgi:hypothetical protein